MSAVLSEPTIYSQNVTGTPRFTPWRPAAGARVSGLRFHGGPVPDTLYRQLHAALLQYGVLIFEPGSVSAESYTDLLAAFGPVFLYSGPKTPPADSNALANVVDSSQKSYARNFLWHIDQAFRPDPPKLTALFGQQVPDFGGDTLFSNATLAYERLDPNFARYLETLTAVHSWDATGHLAERFTDLEEAGRQRAALPPIETPLVRVHPETGKKQIFVNESYTVYIKDVSRIASQSLLTILFEEIKSPEVEARYTWEKGAMVLWDNRILQHRGIGDFGQQQRVFLRAAVRGDAA